MDMAATSRGAEAADAAESCNASTCSQQVLLGAVKQCGLGCQNLLEALDHAGLEQQVDRFWLSRC